jgi:hypothetical protein
MDVDIPASLPTSSSADKLLAYIDLDAVNNIAVSGGGEGVRQEFGIMSLDSKPRL